VASYLKYCPGCCNNYQLIIYPDHFKMQDTPSE